MTAARSICVADSRGLSERVDTLQTLVCGLKAHGNDCALISIGPSGAEPLTFASLMESTQRVSAELRGNGVATGEPIAILAPSGPAWVAACLGILAAGAAVMPLDIHQPEQGRNPLLERSGCRLIYASEDNRPTKLLLRHTGNPSRAIEMHLSSVAEATPHDSALIMCTSGTTGPPKIAVLSHENVLSNIRALMEEDLIRPGDRALLPLPLHHIYPLVVGLLLPLCQGATVVLPSGMSGPEMAGALRAGDVTMLVGVPRLYDALLKAIVDGVRARGHAAYWIFEHLLRISIAFARRGRPTFGRTVFGGVRRKVAPALWRLACGGAALERETEESLLGLGYEVLVGYGLTETAPIVTFNRSGHARIGSAGEPLPGERVRISQLNAQGVGEIEVQGPNVFSGYRDGTAAVRDAFTADGWFRTGDLGRLDADGYLNVAGRVGEALVLPNGEKLNPEDAEHRYEANPAIGEIGLLIEQSRLVGLVVSSNSVREDPRDVREARVRAALAEVASALPSHMQVAGFAVVDGPLPRTPLGKLRRYLLPALYHAARQGQTGAAQTRGMSAEDRALVEGLIGGRVWSWLETRFPDRQLSPDMNLRLDLGVDSLEAVTMTMDLERQLRISLDENALRNVETVRDLINVATGTKARQHAAVEMDVIPKAGPIANAIWYGGVAAIRMLLRVLFHLRAEGLEHLPAHGPYVFCPNHASYLDGPALATALPWSALRQVWWIGGVDVMFSTPVRRAFSYLAHVLPIDRRAHGTHAGLALSAQVLRRGDIVVWFPEGSLTKNGALQPFLPGIGWLVSEVPVAIVPVYIEGSFGAWLPQHRLPRPRPVIVRFGPPLEPSRWPDLKDAVAALQTARS